MHTIFIDVLLRACAIGAGIGFSLFIIGLSPYQAFMVGAWFAMAVASFNNVQREEKRKNLAIFSWFVLLAFYLFAFVIQAFGYETDYRLLFSALAIVSVVGGAEQYIKQPQIRRGIQAFALLGGVVYGATTLSACSFIPCKPMSWKNQVAFSEQALQYYGTGWKIDVVKVDPRRNNLFWFTEQPNFEILMLATRPSLEQSSTIDDIVSFSYNDADPQRTITYHDKTDKTATSPAIEAQRALYSIQIGPREAFNATRQQGQAFIGSVPKSYELDIELI